MVEPRATVVVLTYNPGPIIKQVMEAVADQQTTFPYEVMVIDSGSTDDTPTVLQEYGVRFIQIASVEFQHGRTRNMAVELAEGEFVVFLTHDAVPASPYWLEQMISCFDLDPKVAAVFGKHLPAQGADPITARDTINHFRNFGPDDRPSIQEISPGEEGWRRYKESEPLLGFFSDVNGAIRKSAWEKVPYLELDYAEDQRLGRDLLEAGFKKVYSPQASVYHSHSYSLGEYFGRMYDEFRGLKVAVDYVERRTLAQVLVESLKSARVDASHIRSLSYISARGRFKAAAATFPRAFLRRLAAYLALRHEKLPRWTAKKISLEKRREEPFGHSYRIGVKVLREYGFAEFKRLLVRRAGQMVGKAGIHPAPPPMPYARFDPTSPAPLLEVEEVPESLTLNWLTPPFGIASGGHMTIARIIRLLETFGHKSRIYLYHPSKWMYEADAASARKLIRKFFQPLEADVFVGVEDLKEADALIATSWETAYLAHGLSQARARCYFVQDFEPSFYPVGSNYRLAESTYRFGYQTLTAGHWLSDLLARDYGADAVPFDLAPDHDVYHPASKVMRDEKTVVFYGRWKTHRRGFELASHAFKLLAEQIPDVNILIFGAESLPSKLNFPHRNLGIMSPHQLARLYNQATLGFVVSLTNPSLIPLEMMACGLPVLDIDGPSTRSFFGEDSDALWLADPFPKTIADRLALLLSQSDTRSALREKGLRYASGLSWRESARQVERGIYQTLERKLHDGPSRGLS